MVKNSPANAGDMRLGFDPWVGKIPWRRHWPPTPVFLPGRSHGQRSLAGYSPQGHKELDMTGHASTNIFYVCTLTRLKDNVNVTFKCTVIFFMYTKKFM